MSMRERSGGKTHIWGWGDSGQLGEEGPAGAVPRPGERVQRCSLAARQVGKLTGR